MNQGLVFHKEEAITFTPIVNPNTEKEFVQKYLEDRILHSVYIKSQALLCFYLVLLISSNT